MRGVLVGRTPTSLRDLWSDQFSDPVGPSRERPGLDKPVAFGMGDVRPDGNLCSLGSVPPSGVRRRRSPMRRGRQQ
jgi:hypothetical protein